MIKSGASATQGISKKERDTGKISEKEHLPQPENTLKPCEAWPTRPEATVVEKRLKMEIRPSSKKKVPAR